MICSTISHPNLLAAPKDILVAREWLNKYSWYKEIFDEQKEKVDKFISGAPIYVSPVKQTYQYKMYNCPNHDVELLFEEEYPHEHHCPMDSGESFSGFKYDSAWSGWYNRKLAVRLVWLGLLYNVYGYRKYAEAGKEILLKFADYYLKYPVENTILGPAHVFFGTLSESFWGVDMAYGYDLLYNYEGFSEDERKKIKENLFYPLARITQQFPESASNRQLWYNNVSAAVGFLFKDEELIDFAMNGKYGFKWQLGSALPECGFWGEGPGYHFVTLRGMIHFAEMCIRNGIDLYNLEVNGRTMKILFDSPFDLIKPNFEFPRIKDSGGGSLLDYSMFYEVGYAVYGDNKYLSLLNHSSLKRGTQVVGEESGKGERETPITLFQLKPELPVYSEPIYDNKSKHLKGMGLAVVKSGGSDDGKYLFLDYGIVGGEHGHPDRLQIEYYANGKNWIVDPLNESYFNPNLQTWFRQTIAHNTIVLDQTSQAWANGKYKFFGETEDLQVASGSSCGIYPGADINRTVIQTGEYFIDLLRVKCDVERTIDYPLHSLGVLHVNNLAMEKTPLDYFGVLPGVPGYDQLENIRVGKTKNKVGFEFTDDDGSSLMIESLPDGERTVFSCINPPLGGFYKQMIKDQKPQPMLMIRKRGKEADFVNLFHSSKGQRPEISFNRIDDLRFEVKFNDAVDYIYTDIKESKYYFLRSEKGILKKIAGFNVEAIRYLGVSVFSVKQRVEKFCLLFENDILNIEISNNYGEIKIMDKSVKTVILNGAEKEFVSENGFITIREEEKVIVDLSRINKKAFRGFENYIAINLINNSNDSQTVSIRSNLAGNWQDVVKGQVEWWGGVVNLIADNTKNRTDVINPRGKIRPFKLNPSEKNVGISPGKIYSLNLESLIPLDSVAADYPIELFINDKKYNFDLTVTNPVDVEFALLNLKKNEVQLEITNNTDEKLPVSIKLDGFKNWKFSKTNINLDLPPRKSKTISVAVDLKEYNSKQYYPVELDIRAGLYQSKIRHNIHAGIVKSAAEPPSLSGDWNGWDTRNPLLINRKDQVCKLLMGNEKWNGPSDLSAKIYLMYDKKYLYIGADVIDDKVISHWNYPEMSYPWDTDSIEFIIDTRTDKSQGFDPPTPGLWRHLMLAEYRKTDFAKWRFGSAGGPTLPKPNLLRDAETFFKQNDRGYCMICRIPLDNIFDKKPFKGMKIGFDIAVNDNDGTSFRKNTHIWSSYTHNQVWWVIESIGALFFE